MPKYAAAALAGLLIPAAELHAQTKWGPSGCPPVGGSVYMPQVDTAHFPPRTAAPADSGPRVECYQRGGWPAHLRVIRVNGWEVGCVDERTCTFHGRNGEVFEFCPDRGGACHCPPGQCPCGCGCGKAKADADAGGKKTAELLRRLEQLPDGIPPGGIDREMMGPPGKERLTICGKEVDKTRALAALGAPGDLVDDSKLLRLTVIGPDADRRKVLADLKASPALADLAAAMLVKDYPPDHWAVKDAGFFTGGRPTVYVQAADGKVLHRQDEYAGPDQLAGAIRKAKPDYDPKKDPDLTKPKVDPAPGPPAGPKVEINSTWLLLIAGAVLALVLGRRQTPARPLAA